MSVEAVKEYFHTMESLSVFKNFPYLAPLLNWLHKH